MEVDNVREAGREPIVRLTFESFSKRYGTSDCARFRRTTRSRDLIPPMGLLHVLGRRGTRHCDGRHRLLVQSFCLAGHGHRRCRHHDFAVSLIFPFVTNPPYKRFPDPPVDDTGDPSRRGNHAPSPVLVRTEYACAQLSVLRGRRAKALALQHRARHTTPSSSLATTRRPRPRACERATRCPVPSRKISDQACLVRRGGE